MNKYFKIVLEGSEPDLVDICAFAVIRAITVYLKNDNDTHFDF